MKIKPHSMIFFAPEGVPPAAPAPAAPAPTPSPTPAPAVVNVPPPAAPTVKKVDVLKELGLPGVQGPDKSLGAKGARERNDATAKDLAEKGKQRDFKPLAPATRPEKKKPAEKPVADINIPPEETPAPPVAPPVKPPVEPTPAPVAKIKIGNEELTVEEIQKRLSGETPKPAAEPTPAAPTPQDTEAARVAEEKKFIESRMKDIKLSDFGIGFEDEAAIDVILAGGPEAVKAMNEMLKRLMVGSDLNARKYFTEVANPAFKSLEPIIARDRELQTYIRENEFLGRHPDLQAVPKGMETAREIRDTFFKKYDQIQRMIATDIAGPEDIAFVRALESSTPESLDADIAFHVRSRLGLPEPGATPTASAAPSAPPAEAAAPEPIPQEVPARPAPHPGQTPGARGSKGSKSEQQKHIESLR